MKNKTTAKRRIKKVFAALISITFALFLILIPTPALEGARNGLLLCGNTVIPSLYPFLVVSSFIIGSGLSDNIGRLFEKPLQKIFGISGSAATPLILGAIGGYPVGASAVKDTFLSGTLSKKEASRLLCFAINSSPAFIIGAVGAGFLKNSFAGILLYTAHLLTSFTIGLILRPRKSKQEKDSEKRISKRYKDLKNKSQKTKNEPPRLSTAFVNAVVASSKSIITICAFVVLFSAITSILKGTGFLNLIDMSLGRILPIPNGDTSFYSRVFIGSLEVTNGCFLASSVGGIATVLLTAAILGFCSLSVMFQVISLVKDAEIDTKLFILTRFLNVVITLIITFCLFSIFKTAIPSINATDTFSKVIMGTTLTTHSMPTVFTLIIFTVIILLSFATV